ncbi:hypothetical protein [Frankia sp. AgB32]|uniref:hypothetical protein n=1 Tax=Frankia sp. AgB32 TaxID=631119 RepID=UPI00200ED6BE|nr:hypothetical protein [Frankia sp. AgB32]MCK9897071.1 hypothetical protein [Frankia sp. AgB32]
MPQSSGPPPDRGPHHGSPGPNGRSGPPAVRRASNESISIPPARTPPDDRPEDYPTEPPTQPPLDCCGLGPVSSPTANLLWAAGGLADLTRLALLRPRAPFAGPEFQAIGPAGGPWRPAATQPNPSCAAPAGQAARWLTLLADRTAFAPLTTPGPPTGQGAGDPAGRSERRPAGVAVMSALLAEGQIMEVSDVLAASPVQLALERAEDMLGDLLDAHERTPPAHILAQTARLRRGLERLGRRSVPGADVHRRDVLAGQVAVLGGDAAFKLGDLATARSLTALGYQTGRQAGEGPLRGSAREVAAVNEFYAERPDEALRLAQDGLVHAGDGPVRARLVCQVARALAALGDVRGAAQALDEAYDLADLIPPDQWGRPGLGFDTFHPVEVSYHATTAMCLLGRLRAAEEHAELALPKLDAMDVPGFRSVIRLDLALALARQGRLELDRVCALATEAITISWGRTVTSVSRRADQVLTATGAHSEVRAVRELALLVREWQRSAVDQRPAPGAVTAPNLSV